MPNVHKAILLICVLALVAAACGDGNQPGAASDGQPEESVPNSTATTVVTGIHLESMELGSVLVDGDGFTLYALVTDTSATSRCVDACAVAWPPVGIDAMGSPGEGLDQAQFGELTRPDGSRQTTYAGNPLYRFAGDSAPGVVNGQAVDNVWFVIDANGGAVGAPAEDDYGGGNY